MYFNLEYDIYKEISLGTGEIFKYRVFHKMKKISFSVFLVCFNFISSIVIDISTEILLISN